MIKKINLGECLEITQKDKIEILKTTITFLYEKEGRSKSYISRLLEIDRKTLTYKIKEWDLIQANISRMSPSNQKFINKHRNLIKSRLDKDIPITEIAKELGIGRDRLQHLIKKDKVLDEARNHYTNRITINAQKRKQDLMENSKYDYNIEDIPNEIWKPILGYENYYISNHGRVKNYIKSYDCYKLIKPYINKVHNRAYVGIQNKNLQVARLVGFAFVEGHSEEKNTIDHIDGNSLNNHYSNLEWVSQSENNKRAYSNGRVKNKAYSKNAKFKKIVLDGKYEFKTITAFANFLNISHTQAQRYINNECKCDREIEFIY